MMRQYELLERVQAYNPKVNEELLNKAYVYAMQKHGHQERASGDPYFSHPLEVAAILTKLRLDDATIAVALLHDTIEDTDATRQEIDRMFGLDIGALVDGLTKIKRLDLASREAKQAENFRKLLLAVAKDVRVLLVKLADRLHNMRTLEHVPDHKRRRIAQETLDIYAPLAGRMGIQDFREEMEEIGFRILQPEAYQTIMNRLESIRASQKDLTADIERELRDRLNSQNISGQVSGRQKRAYSIFRKMERKSIGFEQLSDIFGFRVIVDNTADCYTALGIVHTTWPVVPGRFKDYISTPKQNDYRSIHTTVMIDRHRIELQIRTAEMHRIAEVGIAAHALYKEGEKLVGGRDIQKMMFESRALAWLRSTIELLSDGDTPEDFLENTKLELFQDQVFCFTPMGNLIALPRGATSIDFAYAVHTDIGNTLVGAKINGRVMPITTPLHNGDEVEILRAKTPNAQRAWETIARTGKARAAIRKATRDARRRQLLELGQVTIDRVFRISEMECSREALTDLATKLDKPSVEDLVLSVGEGTVSSSDVRRALLDLDADGTLAPGQQAYPASGGSSEPNVIIRGHKGDLPIRFPPQGAAVPGDRIVGIVEPGEGLMIYPIQSATLRQYEDQTSRWVDVRWEVNPEQGERFAATVDLQVINEPGVLAEVARRIADTGANIDNVNLTPLTKGFQAMCINLEVADLKHLTRVIRNLRDLSSVSTVDRRIC